MRAGALRHLVTIQSVTDTPSASSRGGLTATWADVADVRASIEPLTGRERFAAQVVDAEVSHRIRMRHRAGVVPKMRVKFGTRLFDIRAVLNVEERNRELELLATEKV